MKIIKITTILFRGKQLISNNLGADRDFAPHSDPARLARAVVAASRFGYKAVISKIMSVATEVTSKLMCFQNAEEEGLAAGSLGIAPDPVSSD